MYTLTNHGRALFLCETHFGALSNVPYYPCVMWYAILHRGNISLGKLMFRMFTQFHNFMEVCCAVGFDILGATLASSANSCINLTLI